MQFIHSLTKKIVSEAELRAFFSNVSFPADIERWDMDLIVPWQIYQEVQSDPAPTRETLLCAAKDECRVELTDYLDSFAKTRDYDSILHAVSYVGSSDQKAAMEAAYCLNIRDICWKQFYLFFDSLTPSSPIPSRADFIAVLPTLTWPN